jgi:serine/threonine protein kinase/Tol biopolymer transport system component
MQFITGVRLGVYEVIAPIAVGGMGEVYRARDTMLGRDVALKILTHAASADPMSQSRFEREARAVAALSHLNILAIYSFGYESGVAYAAMEWLDGHTLREELANGPLPLRRVVDLGAQMARGLAAAHDKNVVHRDVKPENVFVTSEGVVKLLDFGLARIAAPLADFTSQTAEGDPTTGVGVMMGSLGYMSPEQVSGTATDHRTDVFSLGIVLYEMLTGQIAFRRDSAVETWSATLKEEPSSISSVSPSVPFPLGRIVMRCLEKSPSERFQSARDLAFALSEVATPSGVLPTAAPTPENALKHGGRVVAAVALLASLIAAAVVSSGYWTAVVPHPRPLVTFTIPPPSGTTLADVPSKMLAISPDGGRIVFAVESAGHRELWMRDLASTKAELLPGTQDAIEPFWSPDGQQIGFFADSKLKRVSVDGATVLTLCDAPLDARGAAWSGEGSILFSDVHGGLSRVAATGGTSTRVTSPNQEASPVTDGWPQFLPDGRRFLYLRQKGPSIEMGATVYVRMLDGTSERQLLTGVFNALFVPPDRLLFSDASAIRVQRVDLDRGQMMGDVEEVSADADRHLGHAALAVSRSGTLAYAAAGSRDHRLVWVNRSGHETGLVASVDGWRDVVLSPDGSRAAVQRIVPDANDIWTIDLARGVPSRFTFSPDVDDDPVWSPDGTRIAFSSVRDGVSGIYQKPLAVGRDDELLLTTHASARPTSWSPDGRYLLFEQTDPATASDIWVMPVQGDHAPHRYLATTFSERDAHFSPDGKWVVYTSDESGRNEVYVQTFPDSHERLRISTQGGESPRWASSGHELYFLSLDGRLMAVSVTPANPLRVAAPTPLFDTSAGPGTNRYAPSSDGKRFLLSVGTAERGAAPLVVVLSWAEHLGTHGAH